MCSESSLAHQRPLPGQEGVLLQARKGPPPGQEGVAGFVICRTGLCEANLKTRDSGKVSVCIDL